MIQQQKKRATGVAAPMTPSDSETSYVQNRVLILTFVRWSVALSLAFAAWVYTSEEQFAIAYPLALVALLLASADEVTAYYRYLRRMRQAQSDALDSIESRGEFTGDGVPRDQGGRPFEPLSWEGVQV